VKVSPLFHGRLLANVGIGADSEEHQSPASLHLRAGVDEPGAERAGRVFPRTSPLSPYPSASYAGDIRASRCVQQCEFQDFSEIRPKAGD